MPVMRSSKLWIIIYPPHPRLQRGCQGLAFAKPHVTKANKFLIAHPFLLLVIRHTSIYCNNSSKKQGITLAFAPIN